MAKYLIDSETLIGIANAIREKSGKTDSMLASEMIDEIMNLSNGGGEELDVVIAEQAELIEELSATLNEKIGAYEIGYDDAISAIVERSITEINSGATSIANCAFYSFNTLKRVDFPNATSVGNNAFAACSALTIANIPKLTAIGDYGFSNCTTLASADFPNLTTIGREAFGLCYGLTSVEFLNITSVDYGVFNRCNKLTTVNIPNATSLGNNAFGDCTKLVSVRFPKVTSVGNTFSGCSLLENIDFPKLMSIAAQAFYGCYSFKSLILRSETICTLANTNAFTKCYHILGTVNSTYNPNGDKDGYFYVPKALIADYKVATNWSTYADRFRALEDYTIDGTITGELDPNKI